jgi:hypothetical protein
MIPPEQMPLPMMPPAAGAPMPAPATKTKDEANYRPGDEPGENCGSCVHFDGTSSCEVVEGTIHPEMVSDFWENGDAGGPPVGGLSGLTPPPA